VRLAILVLIALSAGACRPRTEVRYVRIPTRERCAEADRIPPRRPFRTGVEGCPADAVCFSRDAAVALAERLEELEDHAAAVKAACGGTGAR